MLERRELAAESGFPDSSPPPPSPSKLIAIAFSSSWNEGLDVIPFKGLVVLETVLFFPDEKDEDDLLPLFILFLLRPDCLLLFPI